jgi:hypothetical protein
MATKTTTTGNSRQRKQLIFIAIGGVVLLGLAIFQGPKILNQINGSSAPAAPTKDAAGATGATGATGAAGVAAVAAAPLTGSAVVVKPSPRPGASTVVAGVDVQPWQVPQATTGQLWTFSRLRTKDPFVQQVNEKSDITPVAPFAGATNSSRTSAQAETVTPVRPKPAAATTAPAEQPPLYATIEVNGNELRLKIDQAFPPSTKVFELAALKPKSAEIVLASGGKIGKNGKLILTMGRPLTLVNAATGKRYTMKLLYTGSTPEVVQQFSTKAK